MDICNTAAAIPMARKNLRVLGSTGKPRFLGLFAPIGFATAGLESLLASEGEGREENLRELNSIIILVGCCKHPKLGWGGKSMCD
jgi:hypothetical protein